MEDTKKYYELNLTLGERKGIEWIGDRYATGDDLRKIILKCDCIENEDWQWDDKRDYTFKIPEHLAWEIRELFMEEENRFPCFSPKFKEKLMSFEDSII